MAAKKIETLTAEQEAALPEIADRWIGHGLDTAPADRPAAEAGVAAAYRAVGLEPPARIVWADSPIGGARAAARAVHGDAATDEQARTMLDQAIWGQHDAGWLAWVEAWEMIGVEGLPDTGGLAQVARNAGWWWAFDDTAIICERPSVLTFDAENRLHCETGPAAVWPDGWGVFCWHGLRVPSWVVLDPTVEQIFAEENQEIRRAGCESFGWDRLVDRMRLVDEQPDPANAPFSLRLFDAPDGVDLDGGRVLLVVNASPHRDGTRRSYGLVVPDDLADALSAAAWTFGLSAAEYAGLGRAT
jgi:hypothetical protein